MTVKEKQIGERILTYSNVKNNSVNTTAIGQVVASKAFRWDALTLTCTHLVSFKSFSR